MCTKVQLTKKQAVEALRVLSNCRKQYRKEKRYYYCQDCNAWHLTSMADKVPPLKTDIDLVHTDKWLNILHAKENP